MKLLLCAVAAIAFLVGCTTTPATTETSSRSLGPGEHWLPLANYRYLCNLANRIGGPPALLTGSPSDPRLAWMMLAGERRELGWPLGYTARFAPMLEVLDATDTLAARAGDAFNNPCEIDNGVWSLEAGSQIPPAD